MLPIWQWLWACSAMVKILVVTERAWVTKLAALTVAAALAHCPTRVLDLSLRTRGCDRSTWHRAR